MCLSAQNSSTGSGCIGLAPLGVRVPRLLQQQLQCTLGFLWVTVSVCVCSVSVCVLSVCVLSVCVCVLSVCVCVLSVCVLSVCVLSVCVCSVSVCVCAQLACVHAQSRPIL